LSRQSSSTQSADAASQVGDLNALVGLFGDFFNSFQNLSANPTSEDARRDVISKAQSLAGRFNLMDQRLGELQGKLLQSAQTDAKTANQLLADIASLNGEIVRAEGGEPGAANDLRDTRQQKIEELAKYVKITTVEAENGAVDISAGGVSLISEGTVGERLQARTVEGRLEVATAQSGMRLELDGGSLSGTVAASNGAVAGLRQNLDNLAKAMITQVNDIHRGGYDLKGATGQDFFTGTDAASLRVAQALQDDPALIQASGDASARSDNQVALALAQLASAPQASLNNQTFAQNLAGIVSGVSESLASVNSDLDNQKVVADTLQKQRDSVSGVSMDEELTSMVKFQKAFEASAKLITIIDEMLDTVLSLKR
jgi:flagellar hook-associated protein 1 FlgK